MRAYTFGQFHRAYLEAIEMQIQAMLRDSKKSDVWFFVFF